MAARAESFPGESFEGLPGGDLIRQGLDDLIAGAESIGALLVAVGYPRLHLLGLTVESKLCLPDAPESRLYHLLGASHGREAHSQYNALIRQLVSFERALERRQCGLRRSAARIALEHGDGD